MEYMKVKFKQEIIERIRNHPDYNVECSGCNITLGSEGIAYSKKFDIPYFIVFDYNSIRYGIVEPEELSTYVISKNHVVPYTQYEFVLDDVLWEI